MTPENVRFKNTLGNTDFKTKKIYKQKTCKEKIISQNLYLVA